MSRHQRFQYPLAVILVTGALAASCGDKNRSSSAPEGDRDSAVTSDVPTKPVAESPRSVYDSAAVDLQSLFDKLGKSPPAATPTKPAAPPATAVKPKPGPTPPPSQPVEPAPTVALEAPKPAPSPQEVKRERRLQYARELAQLLVPEGGDTQSPLRAVLPLIALETIQPGVATAELNRLLATLNAQERKTADSVQRMLSQIETQADTGADPKALAAAVQTEVAKAEPVLTLGTVALCRRVEAFGRFTPYAGSSFVSGRMVPMVIYAEVQNYTQAREADLPSGGTRKGASEQWALELSQEIHLYSADGTLCWFVKEQSHRDISQSKRRDFFLVQRIDLPASLSIGKYTLKVIVRDKAGAALKNQPELAAEANIPISIVADAAAAAVDTKSPVVVANAGSE